MTDMSFMEHSMKKDPEKIKSYSKQKSNFLDLYADPGARYLNFMIRGFKGTKSGIVLYTPYICGYMA